MDVAGDAGDGDGADGGERTRRTGGEATVEGAVEGAVAAGEVSSKAAVVAGVVSQYLKCEVSEIPCRRGGLRGMLAAAASPAPLASSVEARRRDGRSSMSSMSPVHCIEHVRAGEDGDDGDDGDAGNDRNDNTATVEGATMLPSPLSAATDDDPASTSTFTSAAFTSTSAPASAPASAPVSAPASASASASASAAVTLLRDTWANRRDTPSNGKKLSPQRRARCVLAAETAARRAWERCALVVGLHPDEATDAIVDAALAAGKPFAVVPCCVFPSLFPHRRLVAPLHVGAVGDTRGGGGGDGGTASAAGGGAGGSVQVRTREQLCQFLCLKAPPGVIRRGKVPGLPGPCNDVVFSFGSAKR